MMVEEKISRHLGQPYVYLPEQKKFLCSNGVLFTLDEYKAGLDINAEYERREKEEQLYDYAYAKSTGLLRKKAKFRPKAEAPARKEEPAEAEEPSERAKDKAPLEASCPPAKDGARRGAAFLAVLLSFTSAASCAISTLHTAEYLSDYSALVPAWLMSASVTAYNAAAFEVAVLFKRAGRLALSFVFIALWAFVTLFSMATTVSVYYDRYNEGELEAAEDNREADSMRLSLELLKAKESAAREAVEFKRRDIEYRQEKDYATSAVRIELEALQKELQEILSAQEELLRSSPEAAYEAPVRKEGLFKFLGRVAGIEGGILEFCMSVLAAVFVNLIAPVSLTAASELGGGLTSKNKLGIIRAKEEL